MADLTILRKKQDNRELGTKNRKLVSETRQLRHRAPITGCFPLLCLTKGQIPREMSQGRRHTPRLILQIRNQVDSPRNVRWQTERAAEWPPLMETGD